MKVDREKYEELSRGKPVPYCFEIKKRNQVLFYFGANHSHDPKDKQYSILRKFWKTFLKTRSTKKLVVIEGNLRKVHANEKAAIESGAEGSVVTLWAHHANIPIICPEPSRDRVAAALKKEFSKDEIYYHWFAGLVDTWGRHNPRPDFKKWMAEVMAIYVRQFGWKDFTFPKMKAVHKRLLGKAFSLHNLRLFNRMVNPNRADTIVNQITRTSDDIRDAEILKRLRKEWGTGKSLFVVCGSGHSFLHEPILRGYLK